MPKIKQRYRSLLLAFLLVFGIVLLAACAPKQTSGGPADEPAGSDGGQVAVSLPAWSIDTDCESCHISEVESGSNTTCTYSLHTAVACTSCHSDEDGKLAVGHEKYDSAKQPSRLKKTSVSGDICKSCHDTEELKTLTAALTILTDSEGTVVNPHDLPATEQHLKNVDCSSCHKMHKEEPIAETSQAVCVSCHHQNVYQCNTCHD